MNKSLVCGALCTLAGCFPTHESPAALSNWLRADVRIYRLDSSENGATKGLPVVLSPDEDALHFGYVQGPRPQDAEVRDGIRAQVSAKLSSLCTGADAATASLRAMVCEGTSFQPGRACIDIGIIQDSRPWGTSGAPRVTAPNLLLPTCPRLAHAEPSTVDFGAVPVSDPEGDGRRWSGSVAVSIINDTEDTMQVEDQPVWTDDLGVTNFVRDSADPGNCFDCTGANCVPRPIASHGRCVVHLKAASSFVPPRRRTPDGAVEGSIPFLLTLTDSESHVRMPTINVGIRYVFFYSTARETRCATVQIGDRNCAAERILLTARDDRDQYLGTISVGDSGGEHTWSVRGGTTLDAPQLTLPAYARPDRPISIFITRCDGQATDPNGSISMRRNSDPVVTSEPLLRCDP